MNAKNTSSAAPTYQAGHPLFQLVLARVREFYREPAAVFWVYGFPLILAFLLGLAFRNRPVERIRVDVRTDGPAALASAELLKAKLEADPRVSVSLENEITARERLRTSRTDLVITPGEHGEVVEYLTDPNRPEAALAKAVAETAVMRIQEPSRKPPTETSLKAPGSRYIDFLVPGLIGTNLMGGGLWGVGFVTVDMRVRKLLKRFLATPMKRSHFLLSLMISRLMFTMIEIAIFITFAYLVFDIQVQGNLLAFATLVFVGGATFAGIGLMVACRATTIETVSGLMNAIMLPMYLLSGVFFAADRFPEFFQPIIQILPLTALINGLRAVMNDGGGWNAIATPLLILGIWGTVSFAVALRFFRWR